MSGACTSSIRSSTSEASSTEPKRWLRLIASGRMFFTTCTSSRLHLSRSFPDHRNTPTRVCLRPTRALPRFRALPRTDNAALPSAHPLIGFVRHIVTYEAMRARHRGRDRDCSTLKDRSPDSVARAFSVLHILLKGCESRFRERRPLLHEQNRGLTRCQDNPQQVT